LQLPHSLRFDREVAADFRNLTFDSTRQFRGPAPLVCLCPPRAAYDSGLRHSISSDRHPDTLAG